MMTESKDEEISYELSSNEDNSEKDRNGILSKQGSLEELFIAPAKITKTDGVSRGNSTTGVEYLAGSFSKATTVNGIDSVEKVQNTSEHKEIVTEQITQLRYSNPLERMFSGSHQRSQETEEGPVGRTDRSVPSANSQKILWDGLTDFERIKRKEIQEQKKISFEKMTAVAPTNNDLKKSKDLEESSILIPAGMGKSAAVVEPNYSFVGESLRHNTPNEMQCSMFCGGKRCKYESGASWKKEDMALKGIYSHWITDNILAMARPNSAQIESNDLIKQFNSHGIKSIVNLQIPGEHSSCGPKLKSSGFTYDPNDFMKHKIYHYNFAWKDFGETSMTNLLDMVKVLSFALKEGKVAVHCHAGLGRTGVLIACYLVYYLRVLSNDAIRFVRLKRPNAVQTRRQIACVKEFETYFLPQCIIFSLKPKEEKDRKLGRFSLEMCLKRQKYLVHGFEAKTLKHIPKLLYVICERLVKLCDTNDNVYDVSESNFVRNFLVYKWSHGMMQRLYRTSDSIDSTPSDSMVVTRRSSQSIMNMEETLTETTTPGYSRPSSETNSLVQSCSSALSGVDDKRLDDILGDGIRNQNLTENQVTHELASHNDLQAAAQKERLPIYSAEQVYKSLIQPNFIKKQGVESGSDWEETLVLQLKQYQAELNSKTSAWDRLETETNLDLLTNLLLEWLEHLKTPVIDKDNITYLVILCQNLEKAFKRLPTPQGYVIEYLVRFVARLQPLTRTQVENLMKRIIASLTHQTVIIEGTHLPIGKSFAKLRAGTQSSCISFMMNLYDAIVEADNLQAAEMSKSQKMRQIIGKIQSSNINGNDIKSN